MASGNGNTRAEDVGAAVGVSAGVAVTDFGIEAVTVLQVRALDQSSSRTMPQGWPDLE